MLKTFRPNKRPSREVLPAQDFLYNSARKIHTMFIAEFRRLQRYQLANSYPYKKQFILVAFECVIRTILMFDLPSEFYQFILCDPARIHPEFGVFNEIFLTFFLSILSIEYVIFRYMNPKLISSFSSIFEEPPEGSEPTIWNKCFIEDFIKFKFISVYFVGTYSALHVLYISFFVIIQKYFVNSALREFFRTHRVELWVQILASITYLFNGFYLMFCVYIFLIRINFWFGVGLVIIRILRTAFKNNYLRLKKVLEVKHIKYRHFYNFHMIENRLILHILLTNTALGEVLSFMICFLSPCSAYLLMLLFTDNLSFFFQIYIATVAFSQLFVLFILHGTMADFITIINRPAKILYTIIFTKRYSKFLQTKICTNIQMIAGLKPIGFTYSSFGLITFISYLKFLFIYTKILMILRKNLQREFL